MAHKPALIFIFLTLFLDVLGLAMLIPVGPDLVQRMLHDGKGGTPGEAAQTFGTLQATYNAMAFLLAPLLGVLADRFGRRPVILISLLGTGIDFFAQALAPTLTWFFVTRAINGASGASFTVGAAYVADITPPNKRAAAFGMIGAAFGLGFIIGPLLGGILGHVHLKLPFYVAGGITVVNWLYGLFVLPESLPREGRRSIDWPRTNPVGAYQGLTRHPLVFWIAITYFLLNMAQFGLHAVWMKYAEHRMGWDQRLGGYSLAIVGVGSVIVQGLLARRIVPRFGERRTLLFSLAIAVLAYLGYGLSSAGWMLYATVAFASLGALMEPSAQSLITQTVGPQEQGQTQGALTSLRSVAGILGPLIGGSTFNFFISSNAPAYVPGAPYFVSAFLACAGLAIAWFTLHRHLPSGSKPRAAPGSP